MEIGIIGGGVLGLTLALRRAQMGDKVTIFEKATEPGGLAVSFPVTDKGKDGPHLEKFYHHIFQTDKDIIRVIDEMGLTDQMVWKNPNTSTLKGGQTYRLDGAIPVLKFKPIPFIDRVRMGAAVAYLRFESNYKRLSKITANDWIKKWMGKKAYEAVWKPLLVNKFGEKYDQIAAPWFWSRIHERTPKLGYMRGGFHKLYVKLDEAVRKAGGDIRLGADVQAIKSGPGDRVTVVESGQEYTFDKVVATVPTRVFVKLTEAELPESYKTKYAGPNSIEHYGAHVLILSLKQSVLGQVYWLNINDPGYPFLAAVEHTNLMPKEDYDGQVLMYLGNYLPVTHPLMGKSDQEVLDEFLPHLKRINPDFDPAWVQKSWVWKTPYAQPIVTLDYPSKLPPHQTPLPNVLLANMAHVYPQDRGQNYSIRLGEKMAKMVDEPVAQNQPSEPLSV